MSINFTKEKRSFLKRKNMAKKKETDEEGIESGLIPTPEVHQSTFSRKGELLALYQQLKDLGVRSISDLENLIARAE